MYFIIALWYAGSAIGIASIAGFVGLLLSVFNNKSIEEEFGYHLYFLILGTYALVLLPLAATFSGGIGHNFLFFLGCECPAFLVVIGRLEAQYKSERARQLGAQAQLEPAAALPPHRDAAVQTMRDQRPFAPAPASLASDFDVPPQR